MKEAEAVILAAGYSSRANAFKMTLPVGGKPVIRRVVEAFLPWCSRVIVVAGFHPEMLNPVLEDLGPSVEILLNERFDRGMFSSVRAGVSRVRAPRFFLTPGDHAFITDDLCGKLIAAEGRIVQPSVDGRPAHPILMEKDCAESILAERPDSNLREWLARQKVTLVGTEERDIVFDIDTPEDYERAQRIASGQGGTHA